MEIKLVNSMLWNIQRLMHIYPAKLDSITKICIVGQLTTSLMLKRAYMIGVNGVITDKPRETRTILENISEKLTYRRAFISMILNQQSDI